MALPDDLHCRLRARIGTCARYGGRTLRLHDVLRQEALLVVSAVDATSSIQADQHGDPRRRTRAFENYAAAVDGHPTDLARLFLES